MNHARPPVSPASPRGINRRPSARLTAALVAAACGLCVAVGPTTAPTTAPASATPTAAPTTAPTNRPPGQRGMGMMRNGPSTRPFMHRPTAQGLIRFRDIAGLAAPDTTDPAHAGPVDEKTWNEISAFSAEHFPNRWKRFTDVQANRGVDSDIVKSLRERIVERYNQLMKVQTNMPDLYDAVLNQGHLEDDAWGATIAARKNKNDPQLAAAMREKVGLLVKDVLRERQERLEAIRQTLKSEQDKLDQDLQDVDGLIDKQVNKLTGDAPGDPGDGRWHGGPGGPGRGMPPGGPPGEE